MRRFPPSAAAAFVCCVVLAGCDGPKPVTVKGSVFFPPANKLLDTDNVEVRFVPADPKFPAATASFTGKDKTFTASVVPGQYKVVVKVTPYAGQPENTPKRINSWEMYNRSFSFEGTPLNTDIGPEPEQSINIDMGAKTVSKGGAKS